MGKLTWTRSRIPLLPALLLLVLLPNLCAQGTRVAARGIPRSASVQQHVHGEACRKWIPPKTEKVTERIWIPGTSRRAWVPAVYRTEYTKCGNPVQVLLQPGRFEVVHEAGHYETKTRVVAVPGKWMLSCNL